MPAGLRPTPPPGLGSGVISQSVFFDVLDVNFHSTWAQILKIDGNIHRHLSNKNNREMTTYHGKLNQQLPTNQNKLIKNLPKKH